MADLTLEERIANILDEYAQALRGSWGDIDGRSEKVSLNALSNWIREPETFPGEVKARDTMGVCLRGKGHWSYYCGESWNNCEGEVDA